LSRTAVFQAAPHFGVPGGTGVAHIAAADKTVRAVIEVVAVEFVDAHPDRAGCDERIEVELLVVEEPEHVRDGLVREVAADHSFVGDGIIRLSDFRQQQKLHVENRKSRQDHEISRLLPFLSRGVDEGNAGRALPRAVGVDARHL
jgi:hypothetical protein